MSVVCAALFKRFCLVFRLLRFPSLWGLMPCDWLVVYVAEFESCEGLKPLIFPVFVEGEKQTPSGRPGAERICRAHEVFLLTVN